MIAGFFYRTHIRQAAIPSLWTLFIKIYIEIAHANMPCSNVTKVRSMDTNKSKMLNFRNGCLILVTLNLARINWRRENRNRKEKRRRKNKSRTKEENRRRKSKKSWAKEERNGRSQKEKEFRKVEFFLNRVFNWGIIWYKQEVLEEEIILRQFQPSVDVVFTWYKIRTLARNGLK